MALIPAIFLDKDGTLLADDPYNVDPTRMRFARGAYAGLRRLGSLGRPLIVISNQPGVAFGRFDREALDRVRVQLGRMFQEVGAHLDGFHYCPHHPRGIRGEYSIRCGCRKPEPGLLLQAAHEHGIDLRASWFVGDILDDVEAGRRAGCRTILLDNGNETEWHSGPLRVPERIAPDLDAAARLIESACRQEPAMAIWEAA